VKRNKSLVILIVAIVLGLTLILVPVSSQVSPVQAAITWTKSGSNPVLEEGGTGEWDEGGVGAACVIWDATDSLYKMWYTGLHVGPWPEIGYATSPYGINWTKYGTTPVLSKGTTSGDWDDEGVGSCTVIKESDTSDKMWYTGTPDSNFSAIPAIGYATSSDGISWTKYGTTPVLEGTSGQWDEKGVLSPSVIWDADAILYKMWYSGRAADGGIGGLQIGYATSPDGISWTKSGSNPVLVKGSGTDWDLRGVGVGCVIKLGAVYLMWYTGYTGYGEAGIEVAIGYASSSDGTSWTKDISPVLTKEGTGWEANGVGAPWVTYANRTYRMWYSGLSTGIDPYVPTLGYADYTIRAGGGGIGPGDIKPPRLSDISTCGIAETTADICWKTQEFSDSQVEYRVSPSMFSELDEAMVINHRVRLIGLTPGTTYYYKTMSRDKAGNLAVSDEYTFTTLGTPPAAQVSELKITPGEVDIGVDVTISVLVLNISHATRTYDVSLKIDDVTVATEEVTMAGDASESVTFTVSRDVAATYAVSVDGLSGSFVVKPPPAPSAPAAFAVRALTISPAEVDIGESVTVSILVTNTGDLAGSYEVTLKIDEAVVATKGVTLDGGASQSVTFTISKDVVATYTISIDGLTGTFVVKLPPAVPLNWWLIGGIIAVVVAVIVFIWLNIIRRRA